MPRIIRSEYGRDIDKLYCDGARVGFKFKYSNTLVEHIQSIKKEHRLAWEPQKKIWCLPLTNVRAFLHILSEKRGWSDAYVSAINNAIEVAVIDRSDLSFCTAELKVRLLRTLEGGVVVSFDFDWVLVDYMHELGARFSKAMNKSWVVDGAVEDVAVALVDQCGLQQDQILLDSRTVSLGEAGGAIQTQQSFLDVGTCLFVSESNQDEEEQESPISFLAVTAPMEVMPVDETKLQSLAAECALYPYQIEGVRHLVKYSSALLADDMGLGKTRQAIVAAIMSAQRRIIVCPASLKENWRNEILKVDQKADIQIINSKKEEVCKQSAWIIVNYELTDRFDPESLVGVGVLIVDEAHYLKEASTKRTQNVFMLASQVDRRVLLTGTPLLNRESELYTLLRLSGHPIGGLSLKEFKDQFANNSESRYLLNERIKQWMLRRVKEDVMSELPPKQYQYSAVTPPEDIWRQYEAIYDNDELIAIKKVGQLRVLLERMKLPFILNELRSLPDGKKAIVFCLYLKSVNHLSDTLEGLGVECVKLTGSSTQKQRNDAVRRFQDPESECQVFLGTIGAAGVGINLTAAEYVYFANLPWTPSELKQAEDRAHRRGQANQVHIIQPVVAGTIDEDVRRLLQNKEAVTVEVLHANIVSNRQTVS